MEQIITRAQIYDLDDIIEIDRAIFGNDSRREYIKKTIHEARCIVVKKEEDVVAFLTYDTHFFECSFISLVIVSPLERRKGYATSLLEYFVEIAPTDKIFSSTNRSNEIMQHVFKANGFVESGIIENLDEGDPELIYFKMKQS
ncbi:GNAT family N-acetyltransferase [Anaerobacillus sp. CMMVII]|uniref:GNAT family N-acetyltransferase n=1 Tax=Anaerobacillus sp. CMMVII TaxID=2755588 RepID=UPI0021B7C6B6|nr:GNAT family N-acetyltransferase [Anaerobacillus sp. CMMVII]MCT8137813.1 GNAT family N-acetyltransferase [Anaerobacillus sp. CMMVII]